MKPNDSQYLNTQKFSQIKMEQQNFQKKVVQQKIATIECTIQTLLMDYELQSIQQMAHILIDPELANLFREKFPEFGPEKQRQAELSGRLQKLSVQHSYHEMYIYYQQFPMYIQECKKVLRHKYQFDDILRTHQNRKSIWLLCSGALYKMKQNPHFYQKISQYRQQYPQFFKHTIEKDVVRTVQQKNKEAEQILSSILRNFAIRNPYIGYCQGMNFIVNFLMLMQFTEQESFWLTIQLLEQFLPKSYYTNMMGVAVDICIIEHYVKIYHPLLFERLAEMSLSLSLLTLEWLVCLFTSTLPFYMLVIVWDMMFIYGPSVLLKVCIVILDELEQTILNTNDLSQLLVLIQSKKKGIFIEQDEFISRISKIFIDESLLPLCRKLVEFKLSKQKVELNQNMKQARKKQEIQCNIDWPICYKALKQHKSDSSQIEVWTFKEEGPLKIIHDYLIVKNKKGFKPIEDNRSQQKRLLLGRIPHFCDAKEYDKKQKINKQSIQLEQFDFFNRRMLVDNLSIMTSILDKENAHLNFYRRATSQNLQFLKFSSKKQNLPHNEQKITTKPKNSGVNYNQLHQESKHTEQKKFDYNKAENAMANKQINLNSGSQNNDINEAENSQRKTRNPFKKLKNKWKQRKSSQLNNKSQQQI